MSYIVIYLSLSMRFGTLPFYDHWWNPRDFYSLHFFHRRNQRDFYPLHFFHERSVTDRNPMGSDNVIWQTSTWNKQWKKISTPYILSTTFLLWYIHVVAHGSYVQISHWFYIFPFSAFFSNFYQCNFGGNVIECEVLKLSLFFILMHLLRWYGTPCNIFKDDRILKNGYNHGFKNFKIFIICPQNAFIKFHKTDKK